MQDSYRFGQASYLGAYTLWVAQFSLVGRALAASLRFHLKATSTPYT